MNDRSTRLSQSTPNTEANFGTSNKIHAEVDIDEPAPPPVGRTAARGVSTNIILSLASKALTVVAQVILAKHLSQSDFGLYASALAIATVGLVFRNGGATEWIIQRGNKEFDRWIGPVFWMALTFNLGIGIILGAAAPIVAWQSGSTDLGWMVAIAAFAQVISTVGDTLTSKLRMDLRFQRVAILGGVSGAVRPMVSSSCAIAGLGATSFILPVPILVIWESVFAWLSTRVSPWRRPAEWRTWKMILHQSRWIMINSGASAMMNAGDYAVLSFLLSAGQRGVYLFAFQLIIQSGAILASNVSQVMFPTLAALRGDPVRFRGALMRTLRALTMVSAPTSIGLAAVIAPINTWLLDGAWNQAVPIIIIVSVLFPPRAILALPLASLMAQGKFKANCLITSIVGTTCMAGAAAGAIAAMYLDAALINALADSLALPHDSAIRAIAADGLFDIVTNGALGAALGCGVARAFSCIWSIVWALKQSGIKRRDSLRGLFDNWILATFALFPTLALDWYVIDHLHPIFRIAACSVVYSAIWFILTRTLFPNDLRDLLFALPVRMRSVGMRLLLLRES